MDSEAYATPFGRRSVISSLCGVCHWLGQNSAFLLSCGIPGKSRGRRESLSTVHFSARWTGLRVGSYPVACGQFRVIVRQTGGSSSSEQGAASVLQRPVRPVFDRSLRLSACGALRCRGYPSVMPGGLVTFTGRCCYSTGRLTSRRLGCRAVRGNCGARDG